MRADLHTHSTASDGTQTPADLVAAAAAAGLDVVALTDHDTTAGWAEAETAAGRVGVGLVRGTEVSTLSGWVSVHLLCYLQDPTSAGLVAELDRTRASRLGRARAMVDRLSQDLPVTWADVEAQSVGNAVIGRPHIADALVAAGIVPDRDTAFARLLSARGPYFVPHHAPDTADAVRLVREAGGVPVLAHPGADGRGRVIPDAVFDELAAAGLAGVEVHHRDHSPAQVARLTGIAARLGLLVTGSSDYHGAGKTNRLGEHLTDPAALAAVVEQGALPVVGA